MATIVSGEECAEEGPGGAAGGPYPQPYHHHHHPHRHRPHPQPQPQSARDPIDALFADVTFGGEP